MNVTMQPQWHAFIDTEHKEILLTNATLEKIPQPANRTFVQLQKAPTVREVSVLEGQGYKVQVIQMVYTNENDTTGV